MTRPAQPVLTARADRAEGSFAAGRDVVVGSDLRADLRVAHPLIARAHVLLRFDQGRWLALDNNTLNGVYLDGQRVPVVDIHDGQTINIGKPDGPRITFEVGQHTGSVGSLPPAATAPRPLAPPPRPIEAPRACGGGRSDGGPGTPTRVVGKSPTSLLRPVRVGGSYAAAGGPGGGAPRSGPRCRKGRDGGGASGRGGGARGELRRRRQEPAGADLPGRAAG
ncbi:FHA domain-containing protein, partial [Mycobacterium sp. 1165196.3]|uniref:FHA domain-containing protein n=1 Tax=Mycobacterium sp. 1165196.3 TaxID=1834071 RepID=UPI001E393BAC